MNILFLCTHNSCRSQMAEGLANDYWQGKHNFFSAGTEIGKLNKTAVKVMKEINIDISKNYSKKIDSLSDIDFDLAITLCDSAKENCPFIKNSKRVIHHFFYDPSRDNFIEKFREIRDDILEFIKKIEKL